MKTTGRVTISLLVVLAGCAADPATSPSAPDDPQATEVTWETASRDSVIVALGGTVTVRGAGVAVTWIELLQDSRCPQGVVCVWEGDAEVLVRLRVGDRTSRAVLHTAGEPRAFALDGVEVTLLDVLPHPVEGERPDPADRRIVVRIGRAGQD